MSLNENALATVNEVKRFLGVIAGSSDDDDVIEEIINGNSTLFESYCNCKFTASDYTEYHSKKNYDSGKLFLKKTPINSVASIYEDSDRAFGESTLISSSDYGVVDELYVEYYDTSFSRGMNTIKITYNAGHSTIPSDISSACIMESSRLFKRRKEIDISAKSLPDGSASMFTGSFLPQVTETLKKYKILAIG